MRARVPVLLLLAALLVAPGALAHVDHVRPSIQAVGSVRDVTVAREGVAAELEMLQRGDALRQLVRHDVDPRGMLFASAHRPDASGAGDEASFEWRIERLVAYEDDNRDGKFQPQHEKVTRQWRFAAQPWSAGEVRDVSVGGVSAKDVLWEARTAAGPNFTLEIAAAGRAFADEGARVAAQDIIIYFDVSGLPQRGVNHLYALEGSVVTRPGAPLARDMAENVTVGLYADHAARRAFFQWGGEALLDGRERPVALALDEPRVSEANQTRTFRLDLPQFERSARFVMVSAIEYEVPLERRAFLPAPGVALAALALVGVALLARRAA